MAIELSEKQIKDGWQIVKFGEIAKNISKRVEPSETDLEVYVGLEHLDPQSLRITRRGVPADVKGQKLRVCPGQIIFGKRRAYQKKVAVADFDGICSAHAMVLEEVVGKIIPGLLPFFMQSDMFMDRAVAISEGSLSPTIKWKTLETQEFPLPSIERQKEILEVLEKTEEVQSKNGLSLTKAKQLYSVLKNQINRLDYKKVSLKETADLIRNGFSCSQNSNNEGIPVSRIETISFGEVDFERIGYTTQFNKNYEDYRIKTGDILFSHINSIKHIGKIAIFKSDETLYHGMNLMMIRPSNKVVPDFLFLALSSAKAKRFFESRAKPAINQASLNKSDIETYKYPLPPLKDQLNISERINIVKKEMVILEKKTKSIATLKSHLHSLLYKEVSNELQ